MLRRRLVLIMLLMCPVAARAEPAPQGAVVRLWPQGAPGSERRAGEAEQLENGAYVHNVHAPSLTVFRADPSRANGVAMIVIPGGGHRMLVFQNEGVVPAKALNRFGVTTFVLKYRLAREPGSTYSIEGDAAADARRAIRWVRAHAGEYGVDPHRIGLTGFSAGGELVSLIADNPEPARRRPADPIDRQSARPDFQVLVFPGPRGIPATAIANAPPAFLVAGSRDPCCAAPTVTLYEQLRKSGVSAELHMYADSGHAFNLDESNRISILHWPDRLQDWLADGGWLSPRPAE